LCGLQLAAAAAAAAAATHPPAAPCPPQSFNKPFTRLPAHLMQDLSPDGPLATIGASCGEFMKAKGLKRIDWTLPNMRREVSAGRCAVLLTCAVCGYRPLLQLIWGIPGLAIHDAGIQAACRRLPARPQHSSRIRSACC
jgi:hypothetical protein